MAIGSVDMAAMAAAAAMAWGHGAWGTLASNCCVYGGRVLGAGARGTYGW